LDVAQKKIVELSKNLTDGMVILEIKPYKIVKRFYQTHYDVKKECLDNLEKEVNQIYAEDIEIIKENDMAANNNKSVYNSLKTMFVTLGFRENVLRRSSQRAIHKTSHTAGWLETINTIRIDTGASQVHQIKEKVLKEISEERKRRETDKRIKQLAVEREEKSKELLKFIGTLEVKYGKKFSLPDDAILFILEKDKYLRLAYWLEKNRVDWSEYADYAKIGIDSFSIENDTDRAIHDEIYGLIYNNFDDGRVFRDCTWNYNKLYEMADETLLQELRHLQGGDPP
jgi:hypothetical protein